MTPCCEQNALSQASANKKLRTKDRNCDAKETLGHGHKAYKECWDYQHVQAHPA
jgi:hypothetical protein